jgi:5-methylcytosine-specific restriction endonuclease McrA
MKNLDDWNQLLDELKENEGIKSDAKLAKILGVSSAFISLVRHKKKGISNELGESIYQKLGKDISERDVNLFMSSRKQIKNKEIVRTLSPIVKQLALKRANGTCELCSNPAPFLLPNGSPYLETSFIIPVRMHGTNTLDNIVCLCPNCHAKISRRPSIEDYKILIEKTGIKVNENALNLLIA